MKREAIDAWNPPRDPETEAATLPATPGDSPAPLGDAPSYDAILDAALQLTFPGSDPISVEDACRSASQDGRIA
jgi:hypothetical protein